MNHLLKALVVISLFAGQCAYSQGLTLNLHTAKGLLAGRVSDGRVLLVGQVSDTTPHCGYTVQLIGSNVSHSLSGAVLNSRNSNQSLRVQFQGQNWVSDPDNLNGVKIYTDANSEEFELAVKGNQSVNSTDWPIQIEAASFNC